MRMMKSKKTKIDNFKLAIRNNVAHKIDGKTFYEYAAGAGEGWVEFEAADAHKHGYITRTIKKDNGWSILLIRRK
jgi:hypothetical protein